MLEIGQTVSHYRIVKKLGSGGMGVVYEAFDNQLARKVALKFLPPETGANRDALKRFRREAQAASALNHPNICTIYSIEELESHPFIVMELLEGDTLRSRIPAGGLSVDEVLALAIQIADGLDATHALKIVHRDVKTDNIFITRRGHAKILDFGLAKLESETAAELDRTAGWTTGDCLTKPGVVIGTVAYMSPEHARGEELDERSDLFSLGNVLYEMATGSRPFQGSTPAIIYSAILSGAPARPRELRPDLPEDLEQVILKLLQKKPEKRYQSAAALRDDLVSLKRQIDSGTFTPSGSHLGNVGGAPPSASPQPSVGAIHEALLRQQASRKSLLLWLAAVILVAFAGISTVPLTRPDYYSFIVIGDFGSRSPGDIADLLRFVLERGLSQDPAALVMRAGEFANVTKSNSPRQTSAGLPAWVGRWLPALGKRDPASLAEVSGSITELYPYPECRLDLRVRGSTETLTFSLRGGNALLSQDMDSVTDRILTRFKKSAALPAVPGTSARRTTSELLTVYGDALKSCWRGMDALGRLEIGRAEREFRAALTIDPSFAFAHLQLGKVLAFQLRGEEARKHLEAARRDPRRITYIDRAVIDYFLARVTGKPKEERRYLQSLVALQPYHQEYLHDLAESYFHTADITDAIENYRHALELGPYSLAYNHMGLCFAWSGNHAAAEEALKRYVDLDGSDNAYDSLGDAYICAGRYKLAADMKETALRKNPETIYARKSLGLVDILMGKYRSAEMRLREQFGSGVSDIEKAHCQASLAYLYYKMGRTGQALRAYELGSQLLGSGDDWPKEELIWIKGLIELRRGDLAGARKALHEMQTALGRSGNDATNYSPWYKFYLHLMMHLGVAERDPEKALNAIHDLEFIKDKLGYWGTIYDRAFIFDSIGEAYASIGRLTEAENAYRATLDYNPHFATASLHLAQLLKELDRLDQARSVLAAFLSDWKDADPDAPEKVVALRLKQEL